MSPSCHLPISLDDGESVTSHTMVSSLKLMDLHCLRCGESTIGHTWYLLGLSMSLSDWYVFMWKGLCSSVCYAILIYFLPLLHQSCNTCLQKDPEESIWMLFKWKMKMRCHVHLQLKINFEKIWGINGDFIELNHWMQSRSLKVSLPVTSPSPWITVTVWHLTQWASAG